MHFSFRLLATTAVIAFAATPALAKVKYGDHSFSGGVKITGAADSNVGSAPASPGGGASTDDDDDEEFSLDDEVDSDSLDDIMEDVDTDTEDLAEDDAADADGDGTIDLIDTGDSDGDGTDEITVGAARGKGKGDGDERVQTNFALKHAYAFSKQVSWKSGVLFGLNDQHDRHDLDRQNWGFSTGPEFAFKSIGLTISPSVSFLDLDVNDNSQMQSTIASLGATWKVTKQWALLARYNHEFRNNERPRATDLDVDGLKFGTKYVYGKNLFSAAFAPKFESNDNSQKDKDKYGFELGYARKLPWKVTAAAGFKYSDTDFSNLTPGRDDKDYQYTLKVTKNFTHGLYMDLGAIHKSKDSNINAKDSNGQTVFVSTGWKF